MVRIRLATLDDLKYLTSNDQHISAEKMQQKIDRQEVLILMVDAKYAGWLRFGYFWDEIPFMNLLTIKEDLRRNGYGRQLVTYWEEMMHNAGYKVVMTSTQSDEWSQQFYRKLNYSDRGVLLLPDEPAEILFYKPLN